LQKFVAKINECAQDWGEVPAPATPPAPVCLCDAVDTADQKSNCQSVCLPALPAAAAVGAASEGPAIHFGLRLGDPCGDSSGGSFPTQLAWELIAEWAAGSVLNDLLNVFDFGQSWACCEGAGAFKAATLMLVQTQPHRRFKNKWFLNSNSNVY